MEPGCGARLEQAGNRRLFRVLSKRLPPHYRVKLLRRSLRLTRAEFSRTYGVPLKTLQGWEQGLREPDQTALAYLALIAEMPEEIRAARRRSGARR